MNLKNKRFTFLLLFVTSLLNAGSNNQVNNDHRIRNFSFSGPFSVSVNMDSLSKSISSKEFSYKEPLKIGSISKVWQSFTATGTRADHNIWQIYPSIKLDEVVIGSAKMFSNKKQEVVLSEKHSQVISEIWVNGSLEYVSNDPKYIANKNRITLLNGVNDILIKFTSLGHPWFRLHFIPESRAEITGTVLNDDGSPLPFAEINIHQANNNRWFRTTTNDKGEYEHIIFPVDEKDEYRLFVWGREKKNGYKDLKSLKKGQRLKINQAVSLRNSIKGKILAPDGIGNQFGIVVQAVGLDNNGNENKILWTNYTNREGMFEFNNLPEMNYYLRLHGKKDYKYFLDENGKKRIFNLTSTGKSYHNLNKTIPFLSRGTWDKLGYLDGVLSDYSGTSYIDKENNLWIGTWTGVTVYDGQETYSLNNQNGLPRYPVWSILQDREENVWLTSSGGNYQGGLVLIKDNKVEKVYTMEDGLGGNNVGKLAENINGDLLIGGNGGFQLYNGEDFTIKNYKDGLTNGIVTAWFVEGNSIWIGTEDGLVYYNGKKFKVYNEDDGLAHNNITTINKDPNGRLWIGTVYGLSIYDGTSFKNLYKRNGLRNNNIQDIHFDENGDALIATWSGLNLYNGKTFILLHPRTLGYDFDLDQSMFINKSQDGIYWISDFGGSGIVKYDPRSMINTVKADSFPQNRIWEMKLDKNNNLWAVTEGAGLVHLVNETIKNTITIKDGLRSDWIWDLDIDGYGNIWLATSDGLSKYDGRKIKNFTTDDGLPTNYIDAVYIDSNGIKWLMTEKGLVKFNGINIEVFDEKDGLFVNRDRETISGSVPRAMYIRGDRNNNLAIGIHQVGLSIFDGRKFKNYGVNEGLIDLRVRGVDYDSDGNVWVGTEGSGVFRLKDEKFTRYTTKDGVANDEIFHLFVDDFDKVWVSTFGGGIGVYDGEVWGSLDKRDGLIANTISALTSGGGNIYYFGSALGISKYIPSSSSGITKIKEIITSNKKYIYNDKMETPVSITGNRISFAVSASNYNTHKDKQKFRYRIKEIDEKWSEATSNPVFEWVPNISGDFHFEVQSINRDLNYSAPVNVSFNVKYPWYKESSTAIPFWGFILLIIGFAGYSTKKYSNQRSYTLFLKEQAQKKDREVRKNLEEKNAELLESQKAAEAANEAKSTFLANMSHELRTPLNAIIGYSEMLIEDAEDENEDFIPDLDKINNSGKHLLGLINDILDLSKVESGKMELYLENFELKKVISEIESTIKPLVEKNNNTLSIDYESGESFMKADVTKIRQILLNLLSNSAKFTKEGSISVKVSDSDKKKDAIDFTITDTGIGMSSDQVEKVFQPFTQADEKTTRKFGGTGLGLTITKMFAEMMGGSIEIESEEGKGTTFTVTIPLNVIDQSNQGVDLKEEVSKDAGYTILVIDDDDNAQDMMRKFLEKQDFTILQAKTGEDGLKLAAQYMPDAITLDVMMPEMDGWEVLAALQANEKTKNIPVIMLTMANEPDIGYSLGATDYLTKPVNWEELSTILKRHQIESDSQSILIVEDDETTRDMLRKSLETNEYKVRSAVNGKEALEKIQSSKPGLILLDLMMPEMDGFEFAERLRENKEWLDIPVVVITAKDLTKEDHARLKGNVEAIMQKGSYSKGELLSEVSERIKKITEG